MKDSEKQSRKKIGIAVSNDLSMDQRMDRISSALQEAGAEVLLVGRRLPDSLPLTKKPYSRLRLKCVFRKGPFFYAELQIRLFFFFLMKKSDLLGAVDADTLPAMWMLSKIKGTELLFDSHELFDEVPELANKPIVRWCWKTIVKFMAPAARYRWTVNQSLARKLLQQTGVEFRVIRNLPQINKYPEVQSEIPSHRLILYQGRLNKGRGLEEMIVSMAQLPGFSLVLAGGGDLEKQLRELVDELQLENVTITGNQSPEQLKQWTRTAWIGLNLLDPSSGNYYYSLANKFFDYMACGIPSISMDFPEYRAINEQWEFSLLIPDLRVESIIEAVNLLDSDPELYRRLHRNACHAARELNWGREKGKVIEVVNKS